MATITDDDIEEQRAEPTHLRTLPKPGELRPAIDYVIPDDKQFVRTVATARTRQGETIQYAQVDFIPAQGLENIVNTFIDLYPKFEHLKNRMVLVLWRRRGGKSGGKIKFGDIKMPKEVTAYAFEYNVHYYMWLCADSCREEGLQREEIEQEVFHLLCHTADADDEADNPEPILLPHDLEGFASEYERYKPWNHGQRSVMRSISKWVQEPIFGDEGARETTDFKRKKAGR